MVTPDASSPPAAAPDAAPHTPAPIEDAPVTIGGRLDEEARDRTHAKPEVEDVLAAFETGGVKVADAKQGIARTSKARFCKYGQSPLGHRVMVCECNDADEAERAATFMRAQLVDPRRRVETQGRLVLTVFVTAKTPESDRESEKYFSIFSGLQPATSPDRAADQ
ncbi:MAG: hypothetical protein U1F43_04340 [Myxococcota bacterium]